MTYEEKIADSAAIVRQATPCAVEGCGGNVARRGWCMMHYKRWLKHGDPQAGRTPNGVSLAWLLDRVDYDTDGCLKWPFPTPHPDGYGRLKIDGKTFLAHRAMCEMVNGAPPSPSHEAAHSCGRGHEGCVHPKHLRWATHKENIADKKIHGTHTSGESSHKAKLSEANVIEIKSMLGQIMQKDIAAQFGVSAAQISSIALGKQWKKTSAIQPNAN